MFYSQGRGDLERVNNNTAKQICQQKKQASDMHRARDFLCVLCASVVGMGF